LERFGRVMPQRGLSIKMPSPIQNLGKKF